MQGVWPNGRLYTAAALPVHPCHAEQTHGRPAGLLPLGGRVQIHASTMQHGRRTSSPAATVRQLLPVALGPRALDRPDRRSPLSPPPGSQARRITTRARVGVAFSWACVRSPPLTRPYVSRARGVPAHASRRAGAERPCAASASAHTYTPTRLLGRTGASAWPPRRAAPLAPRL
jgi:hypothetical protein